MSVSSNLFEDSWCDVIGKARRGLDLTLAQLAERSQLPLKEVEKLFEGIFDKEKLAMLASSLSLNTRALLALAENSPPAPCILPEQMARFTTSFHGMEVHSYLLWSKENKRAIAFDTGADVTALLHKLAAEQLTLDSIFLTHNHQDHVEKLGELCIKTGIDAWIAAADEIEDTKLLPNNFSYQLDSSLCIEARPTPGHSPGGTTYVIYGLSTPIAVVGDAIFARSVGGLSATAYHAGLRAIEESILSLPADTILCPGHGPLTTVEEERKLNPFFPK